MLCPHCRFLIDENKQELLRVTFLSITAEEIPSLSNVLITKTAVDRWAKKKPKLSCLFWLPPRRYILITRC